MSNNRVNEIDLLRFFAALSVVFFHYQFMGYTAKNISFMPYPALAPLAKYGYLGVELFFMISGFVILMTAAGRNLRGFVISRVVRLYPAFWACCTITFAAIVVIGAPRFSASVSQYLINMTMLSGFVGGVPPIDGVYWSLFAEMRFYALVAVVLAIRRIHQAQHFLIIWLFASVALEILPISKLRYLLLVDYSAYFIAGAMCFLVWSQGLSLTKVGVIIASWGLALYESLKRLPMYEKNYTTTMSRYAVVGVVTAFFLVMLLVAVRRTGFIGRNRWLITGTLTYPLYLLHQNIGYMVFNVAYPTFNPHLLLWGTILFVLGAAYAVNIFIEKKISLPMKNAINHLFDFIQHLTMRFSVSS
jgi:peptidoglycan/LPS O-acetylase OafA/YrhL